MANNASLAKEQQDQNLDYRKLERFDASKHFSSRLDKQMHQKQLSNFVWKNRCAWTHWDATTVDT